MQYFLCFCLCSYTFLLSVMQHNKIIGFGVKWWFVWCRQQKRFVHLAKFFNILFSFGRKGLIYWREKSCQPPSHNFHVSMQVESYWLLDLTVMDLFFLPTKTVSVMRGQHSQWNTWSSAEADAIAINLSAVDLRHHFLQLSWRFNFTICDRRDDYRHGAQQTGSKAIWNLLCDVTNILSEVHLFSHWVK